VGAGLRGRRPGDHEGRPIGINLSHEERQEAG
jgi:hypothetical protein